MSVSIDIKLFLVILVLIALVVLIIYGILVLRKLLVTLDRTNKILEDAEVVTEIAASRSEDLNGIIDDVSGAVSGEGGNIVSTVSSIAKSAASLRGLFAQDTEEAAAVKVERSGRRKRKR